jgi:hypothetical protein
LTKILQMTTSDFSLADLIKLRCPSCNAPIVGTKPRVFFEVFNKFIVDTKSEDNRIIFNVLSLFLGVLYKVKSTFKC